MIYFIFYFLLPFIILHLVYILAIFGLVIALCKIGFSLKKSVILSFLIFGAVTGFLVFWFWLYDVIVLINPITVLLGDEVYQLSIQYLGDPNSSQAHYTIPWMLRIPQVYPLISIIFWVVIGHLIQLTYIWKRRRTATAHSRD